MTRDSQSHSMKIDAYTNPDSFEEERDAFFNRGWVSVGLASTLAPGSAFPAKVAGQPLLITRAQEGSLHVFHNICRHRSLQLVRDSCADLAQLTCPYHAWSYSLSGAFLGAPYFSGKPGARIPKEVSSKLGLVPVRHHEWFDVIFVDLSGTAPPFEEWIAPVADVFQPFDSTRLRLTSVNGYEINANWKLVCENFLDNYHVPFLHSQTGGPSSAVNFKTLDLSEDIFGFTLPTGEADKPKSLWLPHLEVGEDLEDAQFFFCLFPNTLLAITSSWFQVISVQPEAVETSLEFLGLYVVDEVPGEGQIEIERFSKLMNHINQQDVEILDSMQKGAHSPATAESYSAPYWDKPVQLFHRRVEPTSEGIVR